MPEPPQQYSLQELLSDYKCLNKIDVAPFTQDQIEQYFQTTYKKWSIIDQMYRSQVFSLVLAYTSENIDDFDQGQLAVAGTESSLVSIELIKAVHSWYTSQPFTELASRPKPDYYTILRNIKTS